MASILLVDVMGVSFARSEVSLSYFFSFYFVPFIYLLNNLVIATYFLNIYISYNIHIKYSRLAFTA
jgi:hypothetical protein